MVEKERKNIKTGQTKIELSRSGWRVRERCREGDWEWIGESVKERDRKERESDRDRKRYRVEERTDGKKERGVKGTDKKRNEGKAVARAAGGGSREWERDERGERWWKYSCFGTCSHRLSTELPRWNTMTSCAAAEFCTQNVALSTNPCFHLFTNWW